MGMAYESALASTNSLVSCCQCAVVPGDGKNSMILLLIESDGF